jgi:tRNA dimethylallyltransferase
MTRCGPDIVALVGPTAVGKTDVAVALALRLHGEIISADSMAVYRHADIGTAKPTPAQRALVPVHMVDVADPRETFNVAEYRRLALDAVHGIVQRGRRPIVAGGTGLYVRALLDGLGLAGVPADTDLRRSLVEEAKQRGAAVLHARLSAVDPMTAARLHPNDTVRIVRALEVYDLTGVPLTTWIERDREQRQPLPSVRIGLTMDRKSLDERINRRVDAMIANGLVQEVRRLLESGAREGHGVMRGLGYREIAMHLRGTLALHEAVDLIKRNTRRFARRQWTWFRADRHIRWLDVTSMALDEAAGEIAAMLSQYKEGWTQDG